MYLYELPNVLGEGFWKDYAYFSSDYDVFWGLFSAWMDWISDYSRDDDNLLAQGFKWWKVILACSFLRQCRAYKTTDLTSGGL